MNIPSPDLPFSQRGGLLPWLAGGIILFGAIVIGVFIGYWLFLNLWAGLVIRNQPAAVSLPKTLHVTAEVANPLDIGMNGIIHAKVPINKDIVVPFRGNYDIDIKLNTLVPVNFSVDYNGVIPVDTMASIQARTDLDFESLKKYRNLKIETKLPLKFNLPVHLHVPVHDMLHFVYDGPVKAAINQNVKTHLDTVLNTALKVDQTITTPVKGSIDLRVHLPQHPMRAIIDKSRLHLNLASLRLTKTNDNSTPKRQSNPYGPAAPYATSSDTTSPANQSRAPAGAK